MKLNCLTSTTWMVFVLLVIGIGFAGSHPAAAAQVVNFTGEPPGSIVVKTGQRRLYFVVSEGVAVSYPVGVGRAGKQWVGTSYISSKHIKPAWSPLRRSIATGPPCLT